MGGDGFVGTPAELEAAADVSVDHPMTTATPPLFPKELRRLVMGGVLRALGVTAALLALYWVLPLDRMSRIPLWIVLVAGLVLLTVTTLIQARAILRASHPGVRAIEALATSIPLFILLFSATYFVMSQAAADSFSAPGLTRTDTLYFTVTVFATVGFGDITATSQTARLMVTVQMVLDLIVLGLVVRAFVGAVEVARRGRTAVTPSEET